MGLYCPGNLPLPWIDYNAKFGGSESNGMGMPSCKRIAVPYLVIVYFYGRLQEN